MQMVSFFNLTKIKTVWFVLKLIVFNKPTVIVDLRGNRRQILEGIRYQTDCSNIQKSDKVIVFYDNTTKKSQLEIIESKGVDTLNTLNEKEQQAQIADRRRIRCQAGSDGDCDWHDCPQLRDNEPKTSGRHCPLDNKP